LADKPSGKFVGLALTTTAWFVCELEVGALEQAKLKAVNKTIRAIIFL
jgi:hypothetical protein